MLIHRICTGVIGSVTPNRIAHDDASDSPPLIGRKSGDHLVEVVVNCAPLAHGS